MVAETVSGADGFAMEAETVIIYNGFLEMWVYQNFVCGNT